MTNPEEHEYWHRLRQGGCIYCGYYCIDCPTGFTSCKCTPKTKHVYEQRCQNQWCRVHYCPEWEGVKKYPFDFNLYSSRNGWNKVTVYCGPIGFCPKRKK